MKLRLLMFSLVFALVLLLPMNVFAESSPALVQITDCQDELSVFNIESNNFSASSIDATKYLTNTPQPQVSCKGTSGVSRIDPFESIIGAIPVM
ncbi:hypothetical protein, partial [Cohnella lubricantis]|uniref:hypothetical protein n=1 Tax=Cohnella lubricantis TaxID=2163172 RepID=UPI001C8A0DA9